MSDGMKKAVLIIGFSCAAASLVAERINYRVADILLLVAYTCVGFSMAF